LWPILEYCPGVCHGGLRKTAKEQQMEAVVAYFRVLSRYLPWRTEEDRERPESEWPVSSSRFEPGISRVLFLPGPIFSHVLPGPIFFITETYRT
jgi:hypothetical protein